jgi:DNA-directed RNA polymerase subunit F
MIGEQLLDRRTLSLTEVKELLSKRLKEKELTYEQDMALKYSKQFAKLTPAQVKKALEELMAVEGMLEDIAIKVADILPTEMSVLKLVVPKEVSLPEDVLTKALERIQKYSKEKTVVKKDSKDKVVEKKAKPAEKAEAKDKVVEKTESKEKTVEKTE